MVVYCLYGYHCCIMLSLDPRPCMVCIWLYGCILLIWLSLLYNVIFGPATLYGLYLVIQLYIAYMVIIVVQCYIWTRDPIWFAFGYEKKSWTQRVHPVLKKKVEPNNSIWLSYDHVIMKL